jgi:hypothetical protein
MLGLLLLLVGFALSSCSDNPASLNSDEPPALPPSESMDVDFTIFDGNQQTKTLANTNFTQAAFRALVMKAVVDLNLAIPRALLEAAAQAEAEFNDEGEWVWSYSHTSGEDSYEVRLVASRGEGDSVSWQFFVTNSTLGVEDRLFFTGITDAGGSQGTWTYYALQDEENEAVSSIEWSVDSEENVSLRLEVISDRFNNQGDYIEYTFDGTVKNAIYYNAGEEQTTELNWNVETKAGYLIAPNYNNGEKACWDENFENVSCA